MGRVEIFREKNRDRIWAEEKRVQVAIAIPGGFQCFEDMRDAIPVKRVIVDERMRRDRARFLEQQRKIRQPTFRI